MFRLELRCKNLVIREYRLNDGDIRSIGRDATNHIVVDDPCVSRNHATVLRSGDRLFIWDEGSRHGTSVNGLRVICGQLRNGDAVNIGANHNLTVSVSVSEKEGGATAACDAWRKLATTM